MTEFQQAALLGRINEEIEKNPLLLTISALNNELQQNIRDIVDSAIVDQNDLKKVHEFLLRFIRPEYEENFLWPEK